MRPSATHSLYALKKTDGSLVACVAPRRLVQLALEHGLADGVGLGEVVCRQVGAALLERLAHGGLHGGDQAFSSWDGVLYRLRGFQAGSLFGKHLVLLASWRHALHAGGRHGIQPVAFGRRLSDGLFLFSLAPYLFHLEVGQIRRLALPAQPLRPVQSAHQAFSEGPEGIEISHDAFPP
ncbi:MAG: hypothetical protein KatS3mg082_1750 [Nitrospiraceae bacterium]|nr:MAG: hypothetical protein KatS3mg082_1750 [Nitrospiraceae bacterium]